MARRPFSWPLHDLDASLRIDRALRLLGTPRYRDAYAGLLCTVDPATNPLAAYAVVVIESDGAIELVDSLKSAYPGACDTGLHVSSDPLDAALDHPGVVARQIGLMALSETCRHCDLHSLCGGGHYAHRYRSGEGFRNPSVYCADMAKLISHVSQRVLADVR
jgi:radical SAM protein with 4Fe4S-binding SPASM domain